MEDKKTSLYDEHIKLGAKMVPFGGWQMPVQYKGIIFEHLKTRSEAGVFDVSHMGEVYIKGSDAAKFLEYVVPQNLSELEEGKAIYCQLPNEKGGLIDDIIIYNAKNIIKDVDYLIVINASRINEDVEHLKKEAKNFDVEVINKSDDFSMIALQGPCAKEIISKLGENNQPKFFSFKVSSLDNIEVFLSHSGYTGEDGFEIILEHKFASKLWNKFIELGATPVGLGARDTLRLEAGLPLYGHELNENTTPIESSLGFFVPKEKEANYIGKSLIMAQKQKTTPLRRKLFGFIMQDRQIAREHYDVYINEKKVGVVTSGAPSPSLKQNIGFCMIEFDGLDQDLLTKLNNPKESIGTDIQIMVRNKLYNAKIAKKPFIQKKYDK